MARLARVVVAIGFAILIAKTAFAASPGVRAEILNVERDAVAAPAEPESLMSPRLPKFMDDFNKLASESFYVDWSAPAPGLPAGILVTFEYRQERAEQVKFLHIKYPFPVQGERRATFEISGDALALGGRVTAWRARVVLKGRLLAERSSGDWR